MTLTIRLDGSNDPVDLAPGFSLATPGITGTVHVPQYPEPGPSEPSAVGPFLLAVGRSDLKFARRAIVVPDTVSAVSAMAAEPSVSAGHPPSRSALTLRYTHREPDRAAVALITDENGVMTWHFPTAHTAPSLALRTAGELNAPSTASFSLPAIRLTARSPAVVGAVAPAFAGIWHKIITVLTYPIGRAIGFAAEKIAQDWEADQRPYGFQLCTPPNAVGQNAADVWSVDPAATGPGGLGDATWARLAGGRSLLFVHGIFSTVQDGFGALNDMITPVNTLQKLSDAYGGRVFGFDHPTVSVDPVVNAQKFLAMVPPGVKLDMDVICHSRGGLVARVLAGQHSDVDASVHSVKRIVFAGTPNNGTEIVVTTHLSDLINRITNLLAVLPSGPWSLVTGVIDGILTAVKVLGVDAAAALPGLEAMWPPGENPPGPILQVLDAAHGPSATDNYVIDTNFEPTLAQSGLLTVLRDAAGDDAVFHQAPNDVAVPTANVGSVPSDPNFTVTDRLAYGTSSVVWHCTYFNAQCTNDRLVQWCTG